MGGGVGAVPTLCRILGSMIISEMILVYKREGRNEVKKQKAGER